MPRIVMLGPGDGATLQRVAPDVFDHAISSAWAEEFLDDPRHHLAVAVDADDGVIGFASGVHYVHPDKPPELWVNEVGVASGHRRQGIARRLIEALFQRAGGLGCREAWVLTERENDAAVHLYAGLGGIEEEAVMFSFALDQGGRQGGLSHGRGRHRMTNDRGTVWRASVLLVVGICGCAPEASPPDIVGSGPRVSWAVAKTPALVIGVFNGDPDYQFEDISAGARQSDGDIVVADVGARTVRLFGADGVFKKTLGGPGSGPGEFARPTQVLCGLADSVFVWDDALSRVTRFDSAGVFAGVRTFNREQIAKGTTPPLYPTTANLLSTGELLVRLGEKSKDLPSEGRFRLEGRLLRVSRDLGTMEPVARFADVEQVLIDSPWGRLPMTAALAPTTKVAVSTRGGTVCFGDQAVAEIHCLSADGAETVSRWPADPTPISSDDPEIAAWRAHLMEDLTMKLSQDDARGLVEAIPLPLQRPVFSGLAIDVNGHPWVERGQVDVDGVPVMEHLIFHPSGAEMGSVRMSPMDVLEIGDDYVLGVVRDDLDVQYVHLFAITKPAN